MISTEKSSSIPDQARTLGSLLRAPYRKLANRLYGELAERGFPEIRPAHSAVFRHIEPQGSRMTDLAEQAELTKQSMAYLVGYLQENGYVTLEPDPTDGRAKRVLLTKRGHACVDALLEASIQAEKDVSRLIGSEEVGELRRLLAELDGAMSGET